MSFKSLYLAPVAQAWGEDGWRHCDICCEPDYQDILDAPLWEGAGVPLRPMYRETGPATDPRLLLTVCQKCLMDGSHDATFADGIR